MGLIKTPHEIEKMRAAGAITRDCFLMIEKLIAPGITTKEIDEAAEKFILGRGATPGFKGYNGFPTATCATPNELVTHGIPSSRPLKNGDIVSIDCGAKLNGYHSDASRTYAVGDIDEMSKKLMTVTKECFYEALKGLKAGSKLSDIGDRIQAHASKNGFSVVRDYSGHGIGKNLHEDPIVPHFRNTHSLILDEGMVIAIEPMINAGTFEVITDKKTGEVRTKDGKRSAIYENTVLITKDGCEILTE